MSRELLSDAVAALAIDELGLDTDVVEVDTAPDLDDTVSEDSRRQRRRLGAAADRTDNAVSPAVREQR